MTHPPFYWFIAVIMVLVLVYVGIQSRIKNKRNPFFFLAFSLLSLLLFVVLYIVSDKYFDTFTIAPGYIPVHSMVLALNITILLYFVIKTWKGFSFSKKTKRS